MGLLTIISLTQSTPENKNPVNNDPKRENNFKDFQRREKQVVIKEIYPSQLKKSFKAPICRKSIGHHWCLDIHLNATVMNG